MLPRPALKFLRVNPDTQAQFILVNLDLVLLAFGTLAAGSSRGRGFYGIFVSKL